MHDQDCPRTPLFRVYPPDGIIRLAAMVEPKVVLNRRPTHWPEATTKALRADPQWQERARVSHGHLMFPPFTEFLSRIQPQTKVLMCCQDAQGGISTFTDTLLEIYWAGDRRNGETGILTSLWFEGTPYFGAPHGSLWGSYVLAIAEVRFSAPSWNKRDPNGTHFVELFKRFYGH